MRSRLTVARVVTGLVTSMALLTLAGCGAVSNRSDTISEGGGGGSAGAPNQGGTSDSAGKAQGSAPNSGSGSTASNRVTLGRARILSADLTVRAKNPGDVGTVADKAITLVIAAGGDVAGDRRVAAGSQSSADVTLKVPPAKYAETLSELAKLGKELDRTAKSEDVTDEVVDVASRVSSQTASVERIRKLLASAKNLGDIVTIEGELAKRQADLEALKSRQRALDAQTADATIILHVKSPGAAAVKKKENKTGFLAGLDAGWTAFTASVTVLLTVVGAVLPFLVLTVIVLGMVWLVVRRRRPATAGGSSPPAPVTSG